MASDTLRRLTEVTESLPSWKVKSDDNGCTEVDTASGSSLLWPLFNIPEIAVAQCFISHGAVYDWHSHEEFEVIVLYRGSIRVKLGSDPTMVYNPGDVIHIDPGVRHHVEGLEDSWLVGITIPAATEFPR